MDKESPATLLEWITENTDLDSLDELSLATGIDLPSLEKFNAGEALPDIAHVKEFRRLWWHMPIHLLNHHKMVLPEYISTRRGTLPEDTSLHMGNIKDIQAGDYVAYVPPKGKYDPARHSHWVAIREVDRSHGFFTYVNFGGIVNLYDNNNMSIRFARRTS